MLGGIAAALNRLVPAPIALLIPVVGVALVCLQVWGWYTMMRNIFGVLALTLLAYIPAAILARPDSPSVLRGTLIPVVRFFPSIVVAVIWKTLLHISTPGNRTECFSPTWRCTYHSGDRGNTVQSRKD